MRSLEYADALCESHLPGLLDELSQLPLADLERPGSPALDMFRKHRGPALLIPREYGGMGVGPVEAVHVMRAIGARSPSLAVASAMHHFSVATIFTLADSLRSSGLEWALLEGVADQNLLIASAFAEGNPGQGILTPAVNGRRTEGGIVVSGSKRPCSLARSMDLLSASAAVVGESGEREGVVVLLPAATPGISIHPFWSTDILAGAESDEVRLTDVFVDEKLVMPATVGGQGELDELQTVGFIWFEMIIASCYLGMASALVDRALAKPTLSRERAAEMGIRLETATALLEGIGRLLVETDTDNAAFAKVTIARYGAEDAIIDAANQAVAALGGISFISSPETAYFASACQCLRFHPPSRTTSHEAIAASLSGDVFRIK
ncbi:acyl-CoA dehydrogenase family protein [Nocardia pseudobrasiliensis]|uniref:Alkylation response protein AidB-like acyl-CoA dehydrogenase n=1 Tax=Nocardia pseudobrasiliensis TaxID=45979 RepID=A0A370IDD0_9NOCA|nr:acyl-CoA dehydrogenase family protein [Nocardia pseudobrasiliensis]RDI68141.1 alkylation response protein AidB-like acyl-CoA dehydrogenase [Nocardia pseudobrasiliensis]